jgi:hypothetical protein
VNTNLDEMEALLAWCQEARIPSLVLDLDSSDGGDSAENLAALTATRILAWRFPGVRIAVGGTGLTRHHGVRTRLEYEYRWVLLRNGNFRELARIIRDSFPKLGVRRLLAKLGRSWIDNMRMS